MAEQNFIDRARCALVAADIQVEAEGGDDGDVELWHDGRARLRLCYSRRGRSAVTRLTLAQAAEAALAGAGLRLCLDGALLGIEQDLAAGRTVEVIDLIVGQKGPPASGGWPPFVIVWVSQCAVALPGPR
ncbi:hypothetical protein ACGFJC_47305 [Nonomuraea fuscirosea]|uniref:hypothetical protein n=1 Tax=Nonomuraea fuscirosea TaxID=1291556 RepID=UPI0037151815